MLKIIKHSRFFVCIVCQALQRGPVGLLTLLPKEFTREQLRDLRIAQGLRSDLSGVLKAWKSRGYIVTGEAPNTYVRV